MSAASLDIACGTQLCGTTYGFSVVTVWGRFVNGQQKFNQAPDVREHGCG